MYIEQPSDFPNTINCVVEISKGGRNKYEIDKKSGYLRLDRVLHSSLSYPANYGFVPDTLSEDGDTLDIFVFSQEPILPGVVVSVYPIGYISVEDDGKKDNKILSVCSGDPEFSDIRSLSQLNKNKVLEIIQFLEQYKSLDGKKVSCGPVANMSDTLNFIRRSVIEE